MLTKQKSNFVEHLSWDQVDARIANGAAAILPIGAGAKEHGFHLPMNTDRIQAEELAGRIADHVDALVWPVVTYGYYPAFTEYAGSCTLSAATFESVIVELIAALSNYRCKAVFVLDTGISTIAPLERALLRTSGSKTIHLKIHDGPRYRLAAQRIAQQSYGSHADELETSIMLALAPHLVFMQHAEASSAISRDVPGPLTPSDSASPNYSRSGSYGDPTLATRAKGEILLAAMTDDLIERAQDVLDTAAKQNAGAG